MRQFRYHISIMKEINILGIESSCDETAASIVTDGVIVRSSVVASQIELHAAYGGVVPEIASRAHLQNIYPVIAKTLSDSALTFGDIDAIAVANQPGLTIALMVGVTAAKTLCFALDKPLISIDHLHAHMQGATLSQSALSSDFQHPAVALIVSGGHSSLYDYRSPLEPQLLGHTIDDAAGEAFDKVASMLGLPYPGGPAIEALAKKGDPSAIKFPRSLLSPDSLDFSFSGLKTAVLYHCHGQDMKGKTIVPAMSNQQLADVAASFQMAVIDVLRTKCLRAIKRCSARTLILGGGVACNGALREALKQACRDLTPEVKFLVGPKRYCTDNAVMVASLAYHKFKKGLFADLSLEPKSSSE